MLTPIAPASCFRSYRAYFRQRAATVQESAGARNGGEQARLKVRTGKKPSCVPLPVGRRGQGRRGQAAGIPSKYNATGKNNERRNA